MQELTGFVAYPSQPSAIGQVIRSMIELLQTRYGERGFVTWEENDIAGRCLVDPILERIEENAVFVADITRLNFNVIYEIGYAIGRRKRVFLVRNTSLKSDAHLIKDVGIFDTLGYEPYENSETLAKLIINVKDVRPIEFDDTETSSTTPVYVVLPRVKNDAEIRILSRIKKARLMFRSFDPEEQRRLAAREAIENVARSLGVIIPLLSSDHENAEIHNYRAAFVAGLSQAMEKRLLLLQAGDDPVPLDYMDLVSRYKYLEQIDDHVADFALDITEAFQAGAALAVSEPKSFLEKLRLGSSIAENELGELGSYYLETDEYQRVLRGEVQVVTGRKGSGKTALFLKLRDKLRQNKQNVILDLKPEGYQLLRFKEEVLELLEAGTKEHTITAFWEYLLLLEICHKILQKDRNRHKRDHDLYDLYQSLAKTYAEDEYVSEGDFSERLMKLTQRIADDYRATNDSKTKLATAEVTELLYKHDVSTLRGEMLAYLTFKGDVWILFDNLDKGWPPHGLGAEDLLMLRSLLDAMSKLQRSLEKNEINCTGVIFIRNDVYDLMIEHTPDRGKLSRVTLDWTDSELLREMLRQRFLYSGVEGDPSFDQIWRRIVVSHIGGEESSQYLIERSLMRPRALLELFQYCRSHAVNLGHARIEPEDIEQGEEAYSTDQVTNIGFEIQDILPEGRDVLYTLVESPVQLRAADIERIGEEMGLDGTAKEKIVDLLLWYGVVGFIRDDGECTYVHQVKYDLKRLKALVSKKEPEHVVYGINPAFWRGLEIK
ncbi:MAG: hypothetical protein GTO29_13270 [Candidatus Latescibacteria bacterium]|nr:hypothetical protein [Candidatus Latescibacterota bacterium]NIO56566.1 hypothetical protein [Candidatus Latescibacterota bacterium]